MQLAALSHNFRGRKKIFILLIFINFVLISSGKTKLSMASCCIIMRPNQHRVNSKSFFSPSNLNLTVLPQSHYTLMQETRKIVMAELQNIVYREWLPAFLSPQTLQKSNLGLQPDSQYHPSVNPSIRNEFSTAAYR